jgi:hypothetical protein
MPDQIPNDATRSVINWLRAGGDHSDYWTEEARRVWEHSAQGDSATRLERARIDLAQSLENHVVDSAPEHEGDLYGHLLADAIAAVDWETAAGWLLGRVAARAAA